MKIQFALLTLALLMAAPPARAEVECLPKNPDECNPDRYCMVAVMISGKRFAQSRFRDARNVGREPKVPIRCSCAPTVWRPSIR